MNALFFPPGGLLVWFFILSELIVFLIAFCAFAFQMAENPSLYREAQASLNLGLGMANTAILLTSGLAAAHGAAAAREGKEREAAHWITGAAALGLGFCALKAVEYKEKVAAGISTDTNPFFAYYWLLTGFHLIHVIVGLVILGICAIKLYLDSPFQDADANLDTGVAFWHMCDLIWVLLFPLLYLYRSA